ncbi:FAD:protein FMN transferase [Anaerosalibacter sp. Marseille-P3206]|uniref:FAD:protein FMN transferase n=1 Tax=Anaerosalibacter sp. Marseille-P3206 TaxID=1871005 RepID=UPI000984DC60|nr:FAD:protein FMN transferase [Anaerosalibacter sp. Marseille-P3206]
MKNKKIAFVLLVIMFFMIILTACGNIVQKEDDNISRTEFMMDTVITIKIYDKIDENLLDTVFERLKEIENRMSKTIEKSDVSNINAKAGIEAVQVHEDVYYVLEKALYFAKLTNGAYEPTIGPLVELWNIKGQNESEVKSLPDENDIHEALEKVDYKKLQLLEDNKVFLKEKGMKVDLGGIVKGYAADEIKRILKEKGVKSAIIDLGGNIYAYGSKTSGEAWKIGVQNPFDLSNYIGIINAVDNSIVTSGGYERYFELNGKRYHHIIDSKTGYPSQNELSAVSVISKDSIDGDALSTALFILGIEEGQELLKEVDNVDALFITKEKQVFVPLSLEDKFKLKNSEFNIMNNN